MLKLLLRLWWLQQRRNFSWKDVFVGGYIILIYVVVGLSFYYGFTAEGGELFEDGVPDTLGMGLVIGIMIPDIILKMIMKRDLTVMDDYIKARPLPERVWNRFLLFTNLVSFWNYVLPVFMLPVLIWLLDIPQTVVTFLMLWTYSIINGVFITCYRKSTSWMFKWPLWLGWIGMFMVQIGYMMFFSWMPLWMLNIGMFVLAAAIMGGLMVYLYNLKIYNETKHKASRFHTFGRINLLSLQYIGLMRAKRLRTMVLVITVIFFFDAYMMALMPDENGANGISVLIYMVGAVLMPSVVLSQWTLGIEANYFQGLMTKPVSVKRLLATCYKFYLLVSMAAVVLAIPLVFICDDITVFTLLGAFGMAAFVNLCNMPTCLFSSRLEIFSSAWFNMQGANAKINFFSIVLLIPIGLLAGVYYLWGEMAWCISSVALGMLSMALSQLLIGKLAAVFEAHKYQRMEKFME